MLCSQITEMADDYFTSSDDDRPQIAFAGALNGEIALRAFSASRPLALDAHPDAEQASPPIASPTFHHLALATANLEVTVQWYANVLGLERDDVASPRDQTQAGGKWRTVWLSNGRTSYRIAIMALPGLIDDAQRSRHKGLHHLAFAFATVDELLSTYARLKALGIFPVRAADCGATISFYYEDPDRNSIKLMVEHHGSESSELMRTRPSATNPVGIDVDPDQLLSARAAGMLLAELHKRARAGEFCSASGYYRHCLTAATNRGGNR
jgi:catechol 2,3-dioxygenase